MTSASTNVVNPTGHEQEVREITVERRTDVAVEYRCYLWQYMPALQPSKRPGAQHKASSRVLERIARRFVSVWRRSGLERKQSKQ